MRVEAANTLSAYDSAFIEYGPDVTEQEDVDPALFEATLDALIELQLDQQKIDPDQTQILFDRTKSYIETHDLSVEDEARIYALAEQLQTIAPE